MVLDGEYSGSDHRYLSFRVETNTRAPEANRIRSEEWARPGWSSKDFDEQLCLLAFAWTIKGTARREGPDEVSLQAITEALVTATDSSCRRRDIRKGRASTFWWNDEIACLRKACFKARRTWCRGARRGAVREADLDGLRLEYLRCKSELRKAIWRSRERSWESLLGELEANPWGFAYKIVANKVARKAPPLTGNEARAAIAELFPDDEEIAEEEEIAYCGEVLNEGEQWQVRHEEIMRIAGRIKTSKAPGPDGIPGVVIKSLLKAFPGVFATFFEGLLRGGVFPPQWKTQRLVLIPKGKVGGGSPSGVRPICLLDGISKAFETLLRDRLLNVALEGNNGLSKDQFGFRRSRSTLDIIKSVENAILEIRQERSKRNGKKWGAVILLDIKNAFNTIRWATIRSSLGRLPGVDGTVTRLIGSYLQDRTIEYDSSDGRIRRAVNRGVPQGSVLGPTLWNLAFDALLRRRYSLCGDVKLIAFADDTAVVVRASARTGLAPLANRVLRDMSTVIRGMGLLFSPNKCAVITVGPWSGERLVMKLGEEAICQVTSARYLGVEIDGSGRYKYHVGKAIKRTGPLIAGLSRIMPRVRGAVNSARRLYVTACLASLLYAVPVWEGALKNQARFRAVASCTRRVLARAVRAYSTVSGEALHVLTGVPPLDLLIAERCAMFRQGRTHDLIDRKKFAVTLRQRTILAWQERWDAGTKGRVTFSAIPQLDVWLNRMHGDLSYHLTQAITGHGSFRCHRQRFGKDVTDICWCGGGEPDDPVHSLAGCALWSRQRCALATELAKVPLAPAMSLGCMVTDMLEHAEAWEAYTAFWEALIRKKDAEATKK